MKALFVISLLFFSFGATAYEKIETTDKNSYDARSYGAPTLYYSQEARQQREEIQELRESNRIAKERLEVEREQLQELREDRDYRQ